MHKRHSFLLLLCFLAAGILARFLAMHHELLFDEVWSMEFAMQIKHPLDVFTSIHHDNNHYLNTLYLWWVGPSQPFWVYHIPSVIAGSLLLISVSLWAWRKNKTRGLIVALLLGSSYIFTRYGVEARGFMPMMLFGFLSYLSLDRFLRKHPAKSASGGRSGVLILFWLTAVTAFLWHLTYIEWYIVLMAWSGLHLSGQKRSRCIADFALPHLPILLFLGLLWIVDIRWLDVGGVAKFGSFGETVIAGLAMLLGTETIWQPSSWMAWASGGALFLYLLILLKAWMRRSIQDGVLRVLLWLLAIPCGLFIASAVTILTARLFFPFLLFLLFLLAEKCSHHLSSKSSVHRVVAGLLLLCMLSANALQMLHLIRFGDRRYVETLSYIASKDPADNITVSSNSNLRAQKLLRFYVPRLHTSKIITYVRDPEATIHPPAWLLLENDIVETPPTYTIGKTTYDRMNVNDRPGQFWSLYHILLTP